ncbi:hypothetical protein, partial [Streptomyces antimycoticus]
VASLNHRRGPAPAVPHRRAAPASQGRPPPLSSPTLMRTAPYGKAGTSCQRGSTVSFADS